MKSFLSVSFIIIVKTDAEKILSLCVCFENIYKYVCVLLSLLVLRMNCGI